MEHLFEKLIKLNESDMYPYHMPGHKRRVFGELPATFCELDITEIDGFDNLHQSEEILRVCQEQAAKMYGAEETFYLINGSTCGILAAISCALPVAGHILMARNCHKSAYHAAYLRKLTISYLYPDCLSEYDIFDAVTPKMVEEALQANKEIQAVFIVSPTYEGRIADIKQIADIVHRRGIPLIVDEAHGAHLGLSEGFAKNSCQQGADLVIHSVHKTLPSLTQTALLHVNGDLIDRNQLKRFLRIYQSSSPSYLLMAGIDNCLRTIAEDGKEAFAAFREQYLRMCERLSVCECLKFVPCDWNCQDVGKLLISVKNTGITGNELYQTLREKYYLQLEMAQETFALAMFTVNDPPEAYERMVQALLEIDFGLKVKGFQSCQKQTIPFSSIRSEARCSLFEAWDASGCEIMLEESIGKTVGEFINLYPPGIPLLVPGEIMTKEIYQSIVSAMHIGLNVQGVNRSATTGSFLVKVLDSNECSE